MMVDLSCSTVGDMKAFYVDRMLMLVQFSSVNAIYDYQATSAEEFSFSAGDVIAVTDTDVR